MSETPRYNATVSITTGNGDALAGSCIAQRKAAVIRHEISPHILAALEQQL